MIRTILTSIAFLALASAGPPLHAVTHEWTEQLGSTSDDVSYGVSADGLGNVYISGFTRGDLGGTNAGDHDAFVSKYDAAGTLLWTEQLGSTSVDESLGVSADGLGNVYISGITYGDLGGTNAGDFDAFIAKYSDSVVPEPSTWIMTLGLFGLLLHSRPRRVACA
ncbi:MAG: SBBP repeat-containing protein [Planctomycetales bacterium]|nr:SBBP repeat-containing protein [Planctomycetales bacterium]